MAAVGDGANGSILRRSSGHGTTGSTSAKTIYCAVKLLADTDNYGTFWQLESAGQANLYLFGVENDGVSVSGVTDWGGYFTSSLADISDGEWWHVAYTGSSTTATFFVSPDGENWTQESIAQTPLTMALLDLFDSGRSEPFEGKIAHWREWDAVLSTGELTAEAKSVTAARTTDLTADWRLVGTVLATVLADGVGTAFTAPNGGITVDTDEPPSASQDYEDEATDNATATDAASAALDALASATDNATATDAAGSELDAEAGTTDNATASDAATGTLDAEAGATDTASATDSATGALGASASASDHAAASDAVAAFLAGLAGASDDAAATDAADGETQGDYAASATDSAAAADAASYVYTPTDPEPEPDQPFLGRGHRLIVHARINGHLVSGTYEEISLALQQYAAERAQKAPVTKRSSRARRARTRREAANLRQQIDVVDVAVDDQSLADAQAREEVFKALRATFADEYAASLAAINALAQQIADRFQLMQAQQAEAQRRAAEELAADDAEAIRIAEEFFAEELNG